MESIIKMWEEVQNNLAENFLEKNVFSYQKKSQIYSRLYDGFVQEIHFYGHKTRGQEVFDFGFFCWNKTSCHAKALLSTSKQEI